jgi:hypothetical protein
MKLTSRKSLMAGTTLLVTVVCVTAIYWKENGAMAQDRTAQEPMLAHNVFFTLRESNPENRKKLVAACHEFLTEHEGTVFYAAGVLNEELDREVNDRDFDVGLHIIFKTKADQDRYQTHPRHLKFIEESSGLWNKVRVFDSDVTSPRVM